VGVTRPWGTCHAQGVRAGGQEVVVALGEQAFYSCGRSLSNGNNHCQINGILTELSKYKKGSN